MSTTRPKKQNKSAATNAMLLSVSFFVIFTTLPATVVYVLSVVFPEGEHFDAACQPVDMAGDRTWRRYVVYYTVRKIIDEICLSHYACNFFVFVVTGLEFRRELCRALRCGAALRADTTSENGVTELTAVARPAQPASDSSHLPRERDDEVRAFIHADS